MLFKKYFSPVYFYHLILFLSFSISLNNMIEFEYVNLFFYVLAHLSIIYLCLYHFHFTLYFIHFPGRGEALGWDPDFDKGLSFPQGIIWFL